MSREGNEQTTGAGRVESGPSGADLHWLKPESFPRKWAARTVEAAALLGSAEWVCGLGCGPHQDLRSLLPPGGRYLPADLKQWTPDTELCDLNRGEFPDRSLDVSDTCVTLGVLEYMRDPNSFFTGLADRVEFTLLSYVPSDSSSPRSPLWINSMSVQELHNLASRTGWAVEHAARMRSFDQWLFKLRNLAFSPQKRARRDVERTTRLGEAPRAP